MTPAVFASMLMMGRGLVVTGGLVAGRGEAGSGGCGFYGACPSGLWTFVNLNSSDSNGLESISFRGKQIYIGLYFIPLGPFMSIVNFESYQYCSYYLRWSLINWYSNC